MEQLKLGRQRQFGSKSEKHIEDHPQALLFNEAEFYSITDVSDFDLTKMCQSNTLYLQYVKIFKVSVMNKSASICIRSLRNIFKTSIVILISLLTINSALAATTMVKVKVLKEKKPFPNESLNFRSCSCAIQGYCNVTIKTSSTSYINLPKACTNVFTIYGPNSYSAGGPVKNNEINLTYSPPDNDHFRPHSSAPARRR